MDVDMIDVPLLDDTAASSSTAGLANLPCEIQFLIYEYLADEPSSLAAVNLTCKGTRDAARRVLYDNIMVDNGDLSRLIAEHEIGSAGTISKSLKSLSQTSSHAKTLLLHPQDLSCKNLKLLEFPHDLKFFENATDLEYLDKITEQLSSISVPESEVQVNKMNAARHKAVLAATYRGIRTLAIDLPASEEFFKHLFSTLIKATKEKVASHHRHNTRRKANECAAIEHSADAIDEILAEHFAALQSIELRTPSTLYQSKTSISQGTIVIRGSWPQFPSLRTFKFHGHIFSDDVCKMFLNVCRPTTLALNGFLCNGRHHVFGTMLKSSRADFQQTIGNFSWKNMSPCMSVMEQIEEMLATQSESLKSLSLVRRRLEIDLLRSHEPFNCGDLAFTKFTNLEYLDIDSRFLINSEPEYSGSLTQWLGLPISLKTLSLDAITDREVKYFEEYLKLLLDAVEAGLLPNLKNVRCGFMGIRGGTKVHGWKALGNFPGKFLCFGVWVVWWEYDTEDDAEEDVEEDTIGARVRARAGRRRRVDT